MRLGAHMSIGGGVDKAAVRGQEVGCEAMQIFTKNSNQWKAKALTPGVITAYHEACRAAGITPVIAHSAYLINLAAPDDALYEKSIQAFLDELHRCDALDIPHLVVHPGAHMGTGEAQGLRRIAAAIDRVHREAPELRARVALEVTAGQGSALGYKFEHFATLLEQVESPERLGFCLDTCHLLAAGYDFRTPQSYDQMFDAWDALIGIERIRVIHLNDSKKDLGCHVDRMSTSGRDALGPQGLSSCSMIRACPRFPWC